MSKYKNTGPEHRGKGFDLADEFTGERYPAGPLDHYPPEPEPEPADYDDHPALSIACPLCDAEPGSPCTTPSGTREKPHKARITAFEEQSP